jgi:hypothetical protein
VIEYPTCPTCSRDIEDYEEDDPDPTRIRPSDRPLPARHFVKAMPCGHRVPVEGLQWVARDAPRQS